ncbi:MAG TPA: glycosyltransferase family 2 protein, partial [Sporichthya sp.]|nr:glycosyltransferase family 2 protein [Sporichthya sp.]
FARDALDLGDRTDWDRPPATVNSGLVDPGGRRIGMSRRSLELLRDRFAADVAWINEEFLGGRMDVQGDVRLLDDEPAELTEHQIRPGAPAPRATVVIPTHNHDLTLPITVASVLGQTVTELEVLIVGDGVTDDLRAMAAKLARSDERIRFFDLPKGEHHGEVHRDLAVRRARSNAIFYLCDDDLFLPRHLENLLPLLEDHDLVQCRNGHFTQTGELVLYPTDLADPDAVAWHLQDPPSNCVSITGTAHRRDTYLALDEGWTVTPPGYHPDHYMWRKFLRRDGTRAATHPEMTAIQLPTSDGREELTQPERAAELERWAARLLDDPGGHTWLQAELSRATAVQLDRTYRRWLDAATLAKARTADLERRESELRRTEHTLRKQQAYAEELHDKFQRFRAAHQELEAGLRRSRRRTARLRQRLRGERASAAAEVAALRASRSWQVTAPLRAAGGLARRLRRR